MVTEQQLLDIMVHLDNVHIRYIRGKLPGDHGRMRFDNAMNLYFTHLAPKFN